MSEQNTVIILFPKGFPSNWNTKARMFVGGKWHKVTGVEIGVVGRDSPYVDFEFHEKLGRTLKVSSSLGSYLFESVHSFFISNQNKLETIVRRSGRAMLVVMYDSVSQNLEVIESSV